MMWLRLIALCLFACGRADRKPPPEPPHDAAQQGGAQLVDVSWASGTPAAGRQLFIRDRCFECHIVVLDDELEKLHAQARAELRAHAGHGDHGEHDLPPPLTAAAASKPPLVLARQVAMPGSDPKVHAAHYGRFADRMTVRELSDLVAFLVTLARSQVAKPQRIPAEDVDLTWPEGDAQAGARTLASRSCNECHAPAGKPGRDGPPLAPRAEPRLVTVNDLYAFDPNAVVSIDPFIDIIGRHFKQPKEGLGNDNSPVAHMWRTMANPDQPL